MSVDHTKLSSIAECVLGVLSRFPSSQEQEVFLQTFMAFTLKDASGKESRKRDGLKTKGTSSGPPTRGGGAKGGFSPPQQVEAMPPLVSLEEKKSSKHGVVDPRNLTGSRSSFLACIMSDHSKARRQDNAARPRMDHKSIHSRVAGARKHARRALKSLKDNSEVGEGGKVTYRLQDMMALVNAVKSFRLVFSDSHSAHYREVNIGVDLHDHFISIGDYEDMCARLEERGLVLNEQTLFWEDRNAKLPTSLTPGIQDDVVNPFEC
jgi:hypothetical protein